MDRAASLLITCSLTPAPALRGGASLTCLGLASVLLASWASHAAAQPAAAPAAVEQHKEKAAQEAAKEDVTSLAASLGGSNSTGNTRVYQVNAGIDFKLVRQPHGLGANATFGYGQADLPNDGEDNYEQTSGNFNAKVRYDYFLTRMDGIFAASAFRWDHFAGLDARDGLVSRERRG